MSSFWGAFWTAVGNPVYLDCVDMNPRENEIAAQAVPQTLGMAVSEGPCRRIPRSCSSLYEKPNAPETSGQAWTNFQALRRPHSSLPKAAGEDPQEVADQRNALRLWAVVCSGKLVFVYYRAGVVQR